MVLLASGGRGLGMVLLVSGGRGLGMMLTAPGLKTTGRACQQLRSSDPVPINTIHAINCNTYILPYAIH